MSGGRYYDPSFSDFGRGKGFIHQDLNYKSKKRWFEVNNDHCVLVWSPIGNQVEMPIQ